MEEDNKEKENKALTEEEEEEIEETQKRSRMVVSLSSKPDSKFPKEPKTQTQGAKKRKMVQKTIVTVRIEDTQGKNKSEGPPSDLWSWRKYGQKPIKGSPYPRGYYRCSTSKGCSAKKQVERCRTDASMIIITYTSSHNHPDPNLHNTTPIQQPPPHTVPTEEIPTTPKQQELIITSDEDVNEDHFHYFPSIINQEENLLIATLEKPHDYSLGLLFEDEPLSYPNLMTFSTSKSEENDFFDELGELPISSSFTSFMRSNFFDERILVFPS